MTLQEMVAQAHALFRRYDALDQDDVSPRMDEQRALLEQEGYGLLEELVAHLHSIMPGLKESIPADEERDEDVHVCEACHQYIPDGTVHVHNIRLTSEEDDDVSTC